ncbi:deoxyhypusine synthase family protein [Paludisphaera borealis]|uniref:Deoxyhypusine synthase-like protein n=1 Tax=Paludisphaera borealis TaxID=1387353 RepID=A0A1U7CRW8_9BACT|nr:deoxyhypusine synthase family protein [Paludisphaera borealis]APW61681.1 Deoxyhypusine synthase-like protein [Paludisphaera borealis]
MKTNGIVSGFLKHHFRHFNAATLVDAAEAYRAHLESGMPMLLAMGGAMSTAEIGLSLAEMIRQDKVHAVSCSANNLEEDIFNLVAHDHYVRIPHYRDLTPADERKLLDQHLNRVTDTCIPEHEAIRKIEKHIFKIWSETEKRGDRKLPYEYFYELVRSGVLKSEYQIDPKDSWVLAAADKNIPIFTPGWEDSTLGNIFTSYCLKGELKPSTMKSGVELMMHVTEWYRKHCTDRGVGFFQIGGGIAGDFPICVVPMLQQDMEIDVPFWSYFCQITDTNESYGSYSGANPTEKITWGKLDETTPKFAINSDATIVAPLIFAIVLGG